MDSPPQNESQSSSSNLLSADALMTLRNSNEVLKMQNVGQKGYDPKDDPSDAEQVSSLLEERQRMLELERAARIGDLIQAHWDESLNRSVTQKLKGKFTRHMGKVINGQMTLSPEETVFLLENGFLELTKDGIPISTEEVYSILLKKPLLLERYQVYSHISRMGYLVIGHQEKLKETEGDTVQEKPASSHVREELALDEMAPSDDVTAVDRPPNGVQDHAVLSNGVQNHRVDDDGGSNAPVSESVEKVNELRTNESSITEEEESTLQMEVEEVDEEEDDDDDEEDDDEVEALPMAEAIEPVLIPTDGEDSSNATEVETPTSDDSSSVDVADESDNAGENNSEKPSPKKPVTNGECSFSNVESRSKTSEAKDSEEATSHSPRVSVIRQTVKASADSSNSEDEESSDSESVSSEEELVYLGDIGNGIEPSGGSCANNVNVGREEEVVFVEVTKKEKRPLAVIDLLSDDDDNETAANDEPDRTNQDKAAEEEEDDDDDIQVIAICRRPTTSGVKRKRKREKYSKYKDNIKRERVGHLPSDSQREFNNSVQFPFPNLLRKTIVCLPRPPPHLLPLNVRLNKEAYTMDIKMLSACPSNVQKPRLWNSYKDLQDRRRTHHNSRSDQHHQPFSPNFGDTPENNRQGSFRNHSPQPLLPPFNQVANSVPFASSSPMLPFKREGHNNSCHSPNLPSHAPFINQQQIAEYIQHAQQTAMQVAQNVLSQMTMNMPFPVSNLPPMFPQGNHRPDFPHGFSHLQRQQQHLYPMPGESMQQTIEQNRSHLYHPNPYPSPPVFNDPRLRDRKDQPFLNNSQKDLFISFSDASNQNRPRGGPERADANPVGWNSPSLEDPFPSSIPKMNSSTKSWSEFKSALGEEDDINVDCDEDDDDEVLEIPIDNAEILYTRTVKPLAKTGELSFEEATKALQIFKPVDLLKDESRERCYMVSSELQISYDVYLPGSTYKKSNPSVPALRIVVLRANDNLPRMAEVIMLQRKFPDDSMLQFAVVNDGEVAFYSFNCLNLPNV